MGGPRLTPKQRLKVFETYGATGNFAETARRTGIPESTVRHVIGPDGIADYRGRHAQACERSLRKSRRHLYASVDLARELLANEITSGSGLEPSDIAALMNAQSKSVTTILTLAQETDRRRAAYLTRKKTRSETNRIRLESRRVRIEIEKLKSGAGDLPPLEVLRQKLSPETLLALLALYTDDEVARARALLTPGATPAPPEASARKD